MSTTDLTELHHIFIHAMMLRRVAPYEKWIEIWKRSAGVVGVQVTESGFAQFYGEINDRIERFGFRIDILSDEGIGPIDIDQLEQESNGSSRRVRTKRHMALVNTRSDESAKLGTEFTSNEISLYKKIVDRIILSANYRYCIPNHDCLRLASTLQTNIKKSDAEKLLKVLVKKGWLLQSTTGHYSLSIRSKLELKLYIEENYNEEDRPPQCAACREIVMRGFKCPNSECPKAMHVTCIMNQNRQAHICPSCKSAFNYNTKIGEDAPRGQDRATQEEDDDGGEGNTSQMTNHPNGRQRSKRSRLDPTQESDELDDDDA
ncbi:hypothetical protein MJO28_001959 [Puccinia striiformis f. sp. tritici]|uniref:Non-structural maintenance of chromosomes element 1 homolog n=2 Tax=Puccinia striiformis f. sp. tritici TaxID=168172 RepID=A0A0L0VF53_9BASI|nr:hypothetical protein Pst134EA_002800 [Puccinia striiformis f. sp. tritici]KAI9618141.1 hypothetical protein H4Q26_012485 [Puccinia striiformis f. sp. tritici PST-130]KNE97831.1 hypothetical protein PSTG_08851 [Puccinia striiformis f. sp. tritici PST-78]KAH9464365.1 hypothetical protein Pst134EB_003894 [Puccinia striiformis f. sp. tritici]KAH9472175.1 hypothetical protein Pst134EA_002800 [Puccinia striiformis f. sp. tritici]KAI7961470.1 hypothetical protein MJO28_001959 [Puccinia striiformis